MTESLAEPWVEQIEHGDVRELRMNRPPVNAFTDEFLGQLRAAMERATQEEMKGIVLSGSPGRFSAGFDLPFLLSLDRTEIAKTWQELYGLLRTIAASPIPIVAAMTGHAIAGGTVIAMFCDRRVMAAGDYKIGLNEVQVGIPLPPIVLGCLKRLVGSRVAEYLAVTGLLLSPQKALEFGLVDELHELDFVVNRAVEWCERVVVLPEAAMSTRHDARGDLVALFENALQPEQDSFTTSWFSPSTQKHVRVAVERLGKSAAKG
jgi:enoyl-CoA hydratase/carnithine racemase